MKVPTIPAPARRALAEGVRRGDAISLMEFLGLSTRVIDRLEKSPFQITTLGQLLALRKDELLSIDAFGETAMEQVFDCLARYHHLDDSRLQQEEPMRNRIEIMKHTLREEESEEEATVPV